METRLEEVWQNLNSTDEEEHVLVADDEEDNTMNELIPLCLHTNSPFNLKGHEISPA